MYRKATDQEIGNASAQINKLSRWNDVKAFVEKWYAPGVVKVEVELEGQSDDEGGSYFTVEGLSCYTADGKEVEIDYENESGVWNAIAKRQLQKATSGRPAALEAKRQEYLVAQHMSRVNRPDREPYQTDARIAEWVADYSESFDRTIAFWKKYEAEHPDDQPYLLEEEFEDQIDEERRALDVDRDDTTFDLTTRPTVPDFYVLVAE